MFSHKHFEIQKLELTLSTLAVPMDFFSYCLKIWGLTPQTLD